MEDRLMVTVSGVRGTIGGTLTPRVACDFGCALGTMLGAGKSVVIGRDTRQSGAMIRSAVTAGLLATGVNAIDLGVATTPGVSFMTRKLSAAGGVIITASHNPPAYNGIKFLQPSGAAVSAATAERIKQTWSGGKFALVGTDGQGEESRETRTHGWHVDTVCSNTDTKLIASKRYKVVVDSINGAGCVVTPMLLGRLGCEFAHLNNEPNGQFAHEPEPTEKNLTALCEAVRKHKAAIGFAGTPTPTAWSWWTRTGGSSARSTRWRWRRRSCCATARARWRRTWRRRG
jgi:phosphomannomutase